MKLTEHFILQEFVPKGIWEKYGEKSIWFIDYRIVTIAEFFRNRYGKKITINDWTFGGKRNEAGLRYWNTATGASMSQHKFGRAIDMKWLQEEMFMNIIRQDIKDWQKEFMEVGLTTIEEGTDSWIHADCRYTGLDHIYFIPYYK